MKMQNRFILAGFFIGAFAGLSMGIAARGTAVNASLVFGPLGAFIGWLTARAFKTKPVHMDAENSSTNPTNAVNLVEGKTSSVPTITDAAITLCANAWNFHIDVLDGIGALSIIVKHRWILLLIALFGGFIFPPFIVLYALSGACALYKGASAKTRYRANLGATA